jgi:hypothetical protein
MKDEQPHQRKWGSFGGPPPAIPGSGFVAISEFEGISTWEEAARLITRSPRYVIDGEVFMEADGTPVDHYRVTENLDPNKPEGLD